MKYHSHILSLIFIYPITLNKDDNMKDVNILNYNEYLKDGGKLCYDAYIQCLIDSENLTRETGNTQIELHRKCLQCFQTTLYQTLGPTMLCHRCPNNKPTETTKITLEQNK